MHGLVLAPVPSFILDALDERVAKPTNNDPFARYADSVRRSFMAGNRGMPNVTRLEALLRTMSAAREGERNNVLHWCAHRVREMKEAGEADDSAWIALRAAASSAGLSAREIQRAIISATRSAA